MKEDIVYEEFLPAVYEAETESAEHKVLNVKVKAMTVEKITDNKEQNELKDLKQQIESLTTFMKSATLENVKSRAVEGFLPQERRNCSKILLRKGFRGHLKRGRDL